MSRAVEQWLITAPAEVFSVLLDVTQERSAQDEKWGEQNHPDLVSSMNPGDPSELLFRERDRKRFAQYRDEFRRAVNAAAENGTSDWTGIFLEEVYEAVSESDPAKIRAELVQVAAVAIQWVEAIDRRSEVTR
jgi:hypothetical protein